jgi:putative transposase
MPRANRYLLQGYTYHLTHRCCDRQFLLRFAKDRNAYRRWLRVGARRYGVPVYDYCVTCNHVHLVVHADDTQAVARMMQLAAGATARQYNRRKKRTGPFWEDQYHCTIVESGEHLWRCLRYLALNMVRAGRVTHPSEWEWCGYHELLGRRRRYRVLVVPRLLEALGGVGTGAFRDSYSYGVGVRAPVLGGSREPLWTESLAVGSPAFVEGVRGRLGRRYRFEIGPAGERDAGQTWVLREAQEASYNVDSGAKGSPREPTGVPGPTKPLPDSTLAW